ncbi:GNAT family N-acetyltransferase [Streptomyces sp. SAJ15]|uniref:GNAT family N-acetyltransferase n=1 Tax=Streptomyces sp. SAJ15 TaxID=2011095 RepID=UPI0021B34EC5|nr:GNAT family N-acetyltransferase [Streptomyces sp. SAJ15]
MKVAAALLETAGDGVGFMPVLSAAIEEGWAGSAMLAGLGGAEAFQVAVARAFTSHPMDEAFTSICLTLVAVDEEDRAVGVLSATAPGTIIETAMAHGFPDEAATVLGMLVAKVHGLAVAEHARGQGIASVLLKRAWQVYHQLRYRLLYGSFEAERDLSAFYSRCGYTVLAPGEGFVLDRLSLPFGISAGADQCMFTRWRLGH